MKYFYINGKEILKKDIFISKINIQTNDYEFIDIRSLGKDYTIEIQNIENYLKSYFKKNSYTYDFYYHLTNKNSLLSYDPYLILRFKNKKDLLKFKLGFGT